MRDLRARGATADEIEQETRYYRDARARADQLGDGKPVFKPEAHKLKGVYKAIQRASTDRESILKNLDLMDEAALQAAKTNAARVAHRQPGRADEAARQAEGVVDRHVRPHAEAVVAEDLDRRAASSTRSSGTTSRTSSRNATPRPSGSARSTGRRHVQEGRRDDAAPQGRRVGVDRQDRVERADPEGGPQVPRQPGVDREAPPDEQVVARRADQGRHLRAPRLAGRPREARAEFEKLAAEGKGVFVPRRLPRRRSRSATTTIGHVPGMGFVDAVNNAQKAGLVYLKLNYPIVQGVSNTAMNLIQQGFAFPRHHAGGQGSTSDRPGVRGGRRRHHGRGASSQAAFEGQGASRAARRRSRTSCRRRSTRRPPRRVLPRGDRRPATRHAGEARGADRPTTRQRR
jgi:hypothetical protein